MKKRTVTTVEVHQLVIVRRPAGVTLARCPACLKDVEMVSLEEAAHLSGVSLRDICRRVSADSLHFVETADGGFVCMDSLLGTGSAGDRALDAGGTDRLRRPPADPNDAADQ